MEFYRSEGRNNYPYTHPSLHVSFKSDKSSNETQLEGFLSLKFRGYTFVHGNLGRFSYTYGIRKIPETTRVRVGVGPYKNGVCDDLEVR